MDEKDRQRKIFIKLADAIADKDARIKEQHEALDRLLHLIAPDDEAKFKEGSEVDQAREVLKKWRLP